MGCGLPGAVKLVIPYSVERIAFHIVMGVGCLSSRFTVHRLLDPVVWVNSGF